jgi:hypothetical protein
MKLLGAKSVSDLGPRFVRIPPLSSTLLETEHAGLTADPVPTQQVNARMVERDIFDGDAGLDKSGLWTSRAKL